LVDFICNAGIAPGNGKNFAKPIQWAFGVISDVRELPSGVRVKVYNMQGRLVWMRQVGASATISRSLKGVFLYQIIDGNNKVIYTGKAANFCK
jgi:hypothetical protein